MITNDLWRKASGTPQPLPYSDKDTAGLPWDNLSTNAEGRTACGWAKAADWPDFNSATQVPVWVSGAWELQAVTAPPTAPLVVSHYEFSQLLTIGERVAVNVAQTQIRALTPADYVDSTKAGLVGLELLLQDFDHAGAIDLGNARTIYGVGTVMVGANILTSTRATRVLSGQAPA